MAATMTGRLTINCTTSADYNRTVTAVDSNQLPLPGQYTVVSKSPLQRRIVFDLVVPV